MAGASDGQGRTRGAYAIGAFGTDLFWQSTSFYLLFYYTDVLGLPNTTAGLVFGAAMVWDGLIDPAMGVIANRTNTRRGRYRPYILLGAVPLAAAYVLMHAQPFMGVGASAVFALLAHMLFRTAYTAVSIPYGSLSAALTTDSAERNRLAMFKVLGAASAGLVVALASHPFLALWPTPAHGWLALSLLWGVLATGAFVAMYALTRERADVAQEATPGLSDLLKATLRNPPFLVVISAIMLVSIATTVTGKVIVYYFTYYLQRPDLAGPALAIQVISVIVLTPVWAWVAHRFSKRWAWLGGTAIAAVGQAVLMAYRGVDPTIVLAILALIAVGAAAIPVIFWSLAPDVVEIGEWTTGLRAEGMVFGVVTLGQKVALGVGIGLTGVLLDVIGYHPNAAQAPATLAGLHLMITLPALVGYVGSGIVMAFYSLDGERHRRLVRALEWRAARRTARSQA
ncbi:MAG: hypothetical protein DI570_06110 [Phenylobacterium zucineum]|nr:MAG: hypothetical protein DI570_06110 [Phenylobacterium zucineum]